MKLAGTQNRIIAALAGGAVAPRGTKPFSMLGVTWTDPAARPTATIQVRTRARASHLWSGWQTLETDEPARPGCIRSRVLRLLPAGCGPGP